MRDSVSGPQRMILNPMFSSESWRVLGVSEVADGDEGLGDGTGHGKRPGTMGLKNLTVLASESFKALDDLPGGELAHIATESGDFLHDS